jgi:subtilisin family serine protease
MPEYPSAPELVVIAKPEAGLRVATAAEKTEVSSVAGAGVTPLTKLLTEGVTMAPLFGASEERLIARASLAAAETGVALPDLSTYYRVEAPAERLSELAEQFRGQETILAAYVKPPAEPPQINDMAADPQAAPPVTPDFTANQIYLGPAPAGIEALWAHTRPGGKGNNVRIIDIEGAWRFSHEDLTQVQGGVVGGVQINNLAWRNHGTAVIGEFGGDENPFGVKGIAPQANTRAISIFLNSSGTSANSSKAIKDAADLLSPGDIILIELHRPGPRHNFQVRSDQLGYIAIEWWEDDFQAIKYATTKGVIVVEAAGNGAENLDDALYSVRPGGFPVSWTNPFNRANRDSGAVLVGAGAPPAGTHGRDHGPDRSRLAFSNYGASLDAQGWGREVTTTGYGSLQGGGSEDEWYTDTFSGTSSASPIVVGAVACMQGNRKASGQPVYTPAQTRQRLRNTGSPQQDAPGRPATQRIGNRPNLKQLIGGIKVLKDVKFEKIEIKENKAEKAEIKELKQEKVEIKEFKREKIEVIEKFPERIGGIREFGPAEGIEAEAGISLEERVAALEQALGQGLAAPAPPAPVPAICTAFGSMPAGLYPNPLVGNQAKFLVRQFNGQPAPNTRIVDQPSPNGVFHGLDCGFTCEISLAVPASSVILALVHFAQPATIRALNSNGTLAGTAVMNPAQATAQSFVLNGVSINRVIIRCPQNETLLLRFCFRPLKHKEKIEKIEVKEIKEVQKELKDHKDIKEKEKDKEKEIKELKEGAKEIKEIKESAKEIKEGPKEIFEKIKDLKEKDKDAEGGGQLRGGGGSLEERVANLEAQLVHFIGGGLRPDLTGGALSGEPDVGAADVGDLSQKLGKEAADAKQAKDNKDVEKLSEQ